MNNDQLIKAKIEDTISKCERDSYLVATAFLDSHEQAIAAAAIRSAGDIKAFLWGGYEEAERRILVCIPEFLSFEDEMKRELIRLVRVRKTKGSKDLTHRDYLGSTLGLGIERRMIGDILVCSDGADIVCLGEISEYVQRELTRVGRVEVSTEVVDLGELLTPEAKAEIIRDSISSPRLDSVVSSAFRMSRANAQKYIKAGQVSVDHAEALKPDAQVKEGSIIVLRGKGKAKLTEIGGESRKGRLRIIIERYK